MKKILILLALFSIALSMAAQKTYTMADYEYTPQEWKTIVRNGSDKFYCSAEAKRIAENVLAYQRVTGGWPKNIAMHRPLGGEMELVLADKKKRDDSTIDNGATINEMTFLAKIYDKTHDERYHKAFVAGVDYLLSGQYKNGGWPQFWPVNRTYQVHITYNDDAMLNTMLMIRNLKDGVAPFNNVVDNEMKKRLIKSFNLGIQCILNTQIVVDGRPTVWCQQHDHITLKPASARSFELACYCTAESVGLVNLLMDIPNPDTRIKKAVAGAIEWFKAHQINGIRVEKFMNDAGQKDVRVVPDLTVKPIWARFYDFDSTEPMFCDRDGIPHKHLSEIGHERRSGYGWYTRAPATVIQRYDNW